MSTEQLVKMLPETAIEQALEANAIWLRNHDFEIQNEAALILSFFHNLVTTSENILLDVNRFRPEVKLRNLTLPHIRFTGSIDLGISSESDPDQIYDVLIEAKTWIRPLHLSGFTPNSATRKRKQCVGDSHRLCHLLSYGVCRAAGVLIFERGSSHLRRLIPVKLRESSVKVTEIWHDIARPSLGKRLEHIGLLWLQPPTADK